MRSASLLRLLYAAASGEDNRTEAPRREASILVPMHVAAFGVYVVFAAYGVLPPSTVIA